jgi:DNA-binding IclR family transcriptional regulator
MQKDETQPPNTPRYPIGSVDRVLRLLLLFRDRPSIRVADAASELGVAGSTAHRLLAMLQMHGFVAEDHKTRRYLPGPAILELSSAVNREADITGILKAATEELCERLGETVNAAILQHNSAVFTAGTECRHALRIADQTGLRIAAFHSAPGKAMLADLPLARLRALYPSEILKDPTNGIVMNRADLEAELDVIRATGYATNTIPNSPSAVDFVSLSVAVSRGDKAAVALSVAAPAQRATAEWQERTVRELRRVTKALEKQLN